VNNSLPDLDRRERTTLWPLAVLALIMGVVPTAWLRTIDPAVSKSVQQVTGVQVQTENGLPLGLAQNGASQSSGLKAVAEVNGR
jgi:hypothetical protein